MYMRFVQAHFKRESLWKIAMLYDSIIIPRLEKTDGCLHVCLMRNENHLDRGISMTIWESKEKMEAYVKSGLYTENLAEIKPYLTSSTEWRIQMSKDMKLEYEPINAEPIVQVFEPLAQTTGDISNMEKIYVSNIRLVTAKVQPGKMEDFAQIYRDEIMPALRKVKGCRFAYLVESKENENETISVTIWDSKKEADEYEKSGLFNEFVEKLKPSFSKLYQWKIESDEKEEERTLTSDDLAVEYYSIITGKCF